MQSMHGVLTVAKGVDVHQVEKRFEQLLGCPATFTVTEDPALLGGFIAEIDGQIFDASLRTRLAQMERYLNQ